MPTPKNQPKGFKELAALSFGYVSSVGFFIFCGTGYWLDQKFQTGFVWTVAGVVVGISLVVYELWKIIRNLNNPNTPKK